MTARVRVLIFARAPGEDPSGPARAYHEISSLLAGTEGLAGNELLRSATDPNAFIVMSEWDSLEAFRSWEATREHRAVTSPLRPFHDRRNGAPYGIYLIEAAY